MNKGFTLIELVVVIVVLGILSTVALLKLASFSKGTRSEVLGQISVSVKNCQQLYVH
jgi:prepilin-type N-terminal cleavage/methylation domain-containing protein